MSQKSCDYNSSQTAWWITLKLSGNFPLGIYVVVHLTKKFTAAFASTQYYQSPLLFCATNNNVWNVFFLLQLNVELTMTAHLTKLANKKRVSTRAFPVHHVAGAQNAALNITNHAASALSGCKVTPWWRVSVLNVTWTMTVEMIRNVRYWVRLVYLCVLLVPAQLTPRVSEEIISLNVLVILDLEDLVMLPA